MQIVMIPAKCNAMYDNGFNDLQYADNLTMIKKENASGEQVINRNVSMSQLSFGRYTSIINNIFSPSISYK